MDQAGHTVSDDSGRDAAALLELVAGVFGGLLGVTAGADDDFFDLGGHSMLAVVAMSELSDMVDCELPVGLIFEHPTAQELASAVGQHAAAAA
ncbi:Linear gramicidin synthase subunit D [Streptomyces malaysiensis subsp. malaysiensis]|uniref:phosphopantetheine-binding protein n=1 Tax=Streptomyces malaysiensis TaxID=92644 RepID=UPI000C2BFDA6|nr:MULTISPECIES: phosphopantetheine-binding protein [unclassified Streptomyces]AUA07959.1 Linear gramicidin synthase subunit D [Streptomyces sp. M56]